jgi:hypothetical protein
MTREHLWKAAIAMTAAGVIALGGMFISAPRAHAQASADSDLELAAVGLFIAPVQLNLAGKDANLVGLGSFIVNAQADCNGCHNSSPMDSEFGSTSTSNNPYLLFPNQRPWKAQAANYLGGGQNFGPVGPGVSSGPYDSSAFGPGLGPNIITRNLTPDYTGLPEGGHTLAQFLNIMETGHDYDQLHLNCSATVTTNCYSAPPNGEVNGAVLQIMPWPAFSNMTVTQLTAIWTYLSAIPCISNTGSPYPNLINACTQP